MILHLSQSPVTTSQIILPPSQYIEQQQQCIFSPQESAINSWSKHIDKLHHFICELVWKSQISTHMINTKLKPADYLTKNAQK